MIEMECHTLKLISGRGRGLESDQDEESPSNHHSQSFIIQIRKSERDCVLKNENTAGHFSSFWTRRCSSQCRWDAWRSICQVILPE